jgi:protease-4
MKQFFKMFFASFLAIVVSCVILAGLIIGMLVGLASKVNKESKTKPSSVLVIDLGKRIHEQGSINSFPLFSDNSGYGDGLYDILEDIKRAKTDNNIKGILIKMQPNPNGWATIEQLRMALEDFKTSKKFIYAYGDDVTQGAYYVGSVADSVFINPVGEIVLKGFAMQSPYFKGTLEKLEVQPEIFYAGKFKSATEPFRADKMSDANRLQVSVFLHSFWNEYIKAVMEHTKLDSNTINQLANSGAIQFPSDALQYKIVDGLLYWDQVEQILRAKTGKKDNEEINYVSLGTYKDNDIKLDVDANEQKIAILNAEGDIVDGEETEDYTIASKTFIENIRKIRKNDKIKAVVLRINSPGGSALASDEILRELQLLKEKKPIVVAMGDYAASGGYYISCAADSVFAMPNTITGSIGVFSMLFNVEGLMKNKLGVTFDGVKTAPYADFPTASRPLTEDEAKRMQNSVDKIYGIFKGHVVDGRKLKPADVDSIAQGRVWTGADAIQIGLVDAIGNLDRAVKSAATLAKLSNYKVVTYPQPIDKLQMLIKRMKGADASTTAMVQQAMKKDMGSEFEWYRQLQNLFKINGKAMMAMPFIISVK